MHAPSHESAEKAFPFGPPDGSSEALADPLDTAQFVSFRSQSPLGIRADDRSVRVIVGRKGAGKTLYLRRLQAATNLDDSLFAVPWRSSLPRTKDVIRVSDWADRPGDCVELWQEVWRAAIVRALSSLVITKNLHCDPALREDLDSYQDLLGKHRFPQPIYGHVRDIIRSHDNARRLDAYLDDSRWNDVEHLLNAALESSKPVFFYLDSLDDNFHHAPGEWLLCQKGLFLEVMRLLEGNHFDRRLHVIIGIRDVVFTSLQNDEHATRYVTSSYIRHLDWDYAAIQFFLRQKIDRLPAAFCMHPDADDPIERWLGQTSIRNKLGDGADERLEEYLLRHTRLIPRDVVVLGNRLCELIAHAKANAHPFLSDADVRHAVHEVSEGFGREQLGIAANHLTANQMPRYAAEQEIDNIYTGERTASFEGADALQTAVRDALSSALSKIGRNRFTRATLDGLEGEMAKIRGPGDVGSVLWQEGLIGYIDGVGVETSAPTFYAAGKRDVLRLPRDKRAFALHPILIDAVPGLRGVGEVVRPW